MIAPPVWFMHGGLSHPPCLPKLGDMVPLQVERFWDMVWPFSVLFGRFYFLFWRYVQYDVAKRTYSYRRNKMKNKIEILDLMYRTPTVAFTYKQYTFVPSHFLPIPEKCKMMWQHKPILRNTRTWFKNVFTTKNYTVTRCRVLTMSLLHQNKKRHTFTI